MPDLLRRFGVKEPLRILVTGGLGFVGSHLVERLAAAGHSLTVVDNGANPVVSAESFERICAINRLDASAVDTLSGPFDQIYHLSDIAGPARVIHYGGELAKTSITGVHAVLAASKRWGARTLVVSSSEVYGQTGAFSESEPLTVPARATARLEYAASKILGEVATLNAARSHEIDVNIVRPFNIAGPRQSSAGGFVIPRFFEAALEQRPLQVFEGGEQSRAFCHVLDMVDSFVAVMESPYTAETFNSGNAANSIEIGRLAAQIRDLTGSSSPIDYLDGAEVFGPLYVESFDKTPNTAKIEAMVGWQPTRSLDQVLADVHESMTDTRTVLR